MGRFDRRDRRGWNRPHHHDRDRPPRIEFREPRPGRMMPSGLRRMFMGAGADVTVVVRTHNGEEHLEELIQAVKGQESGYQVELLALDSDSTDRTPLILRAHGIRTLPVTTEEEARGKAIETAEGRVVVFVSQDSLPRGRDWLSTLAGPLVDGEKAGMASGRLIPDAAVPPYQRGLIQARPWISGKEKLEFDAGSESPGRFFAPETNVAVARKAALGCADPGNLEGLCRQLLDKGLRKLYLPGAALITRGMGFAAQGQRRGGPDATLLSGLACVATGLGRELYEIREHGDLQRGERGEAYAVSLALHLAEAVRLANERAPVLKVAAERVSPLLRKLLGV